MFPSGGGRVNSGNTNSGTSASGPSGRASGTSQLVNNTLAICPRRSCALICGYFVIDFAVPEARPECSAASFVSFNFPGLF